MPSQKIMEPHDPDGVSRYQIDWEDFLDGATISSDTWTVPSGLTKDSEATAGTVSTVYVSGGTDGDDYAVVCAMTTSDGRVEERTLTIPCREK